MARFPILDFEDVVQVGDKQRMDADGSYHTPDEADFTLYELEPDSGDGFIDITSDKRLDFQYATAGTKTASLRVTNAQGATTATFSIEVLSEADDNLFSTDQELKGFEPKILKYLPLGKASFKFYHRRSQNLIMDTIDRRGYRDNENERYTKADIVETVEVREWSACLTLMIIFEGLSNAVDDIFHDKAKRYRGHADKASNRAKLALDKDGSGSISDAERQATFQDVVVVRR